MPNPSSFDTHEEQLEWYRKYRADRREHFRAYNLVYNKAWRKQKGYPSEIKSKIKYPEKIKAHREVFKAKKAGIIIKGKCEVCGSDKTQAHHDDYSKPLKVRWLCPIHHSEHHRNERLKKQNKGLVKQ